MKGNVKATKMQEDAEVSFNFTLKADPAFDEKLFSMQQSQNR